MHHTDIVQRILVRLDVDVRQSEQKSLYVFHFFFLIFSLFDFPLDIYVYVYIYLYIQGASQYVEPTTEVNREHKNNEKSSLLDMSPTRLSFEFIATLIFQ